ncbi:hypothetical protein ABKA04_001298 [Annulohypoxylon sp. FPYF3050]
MPPEDWDLTKVGRRVLMHLSGQMISDLKGIDSVPILKYHAAHMMARAELAIDPNVKRVLIRMAAFAQIEIRRFCGLRVLRPDVPLEDIRDECADIGRDQCWRGGLWTIFGVYQALKRRNAFDRGDSPDISVNQTIGSMIVNCHIGEDIARIVGWAEAKFGLGAAFPERELELTSLNNNQIAEVEFSLLRVWFHRAVRVTRTESGRLKFRDLASDVRVGVVLGEELLSFDDVRDRRQSQDNNFNFAIYQHNQGEGLGNREVRTLT